MKRLLTASLAAAAFTLGAGSIYAQQTFYSSDFESETVDSRPSGDFTFSPSSSNTDTNGMVIVGPSSSPAAIDGDRSLYIYDQSGGDPTHMRWDFAGGQNVSRLRIDVDFQRAYGTDETDEDSRVHIGVARAGDQTNNSDFRPFEIRMLNNGTLSINHLDGTEHNIPYDTGSLNHLTVFANSHDSLSAAYSDAELGDDVLAPNTFHVYLNGELVGQYAFHVTPDPDNAPQIVFNESDTDLGRLGIYQDTSRQGGIIFDNLVLQDFGGPYFQSDFEGDTVGEQPVGPFTFSPSSNTGTNGSVIVGAGSEVPAISGDKSLLIYDETGGDPTHMRWDFAGGENKSRLRIDVDFQRAFATELTDEDTRVHIGVARAGDQTNNSDFRPFELRILNNGTLAVNSLEGTTWEITYNTEGVNSLTVFANSHDSLSAEYSDPDLGSGTVEPNSFHVFLNGESAGVYNFFVTPDPANAPQIVFNESDEDLGRFAFYQDTSRQGAMVFDNLVLQDFGAEGGEPPAAPSNLAAAEATAQFVRLAWTDNSADELGFVIRRSTGSGSFEDIGSVPTDETEFMDESVNGETSYTYRVYATNGVLSDFAEVDVTTPAQDVPLVMEFSADAQIAQGQELELSVTAVGEAPLSYQWYIGESGDASNPVAGATSATFQTGPLGETTQFWVRVTNTHGTDDSPTVTIDVHVPQIYDVNSVAQLNDLLDMDLRPGDTIVVAPGRYEDAHISLKASGAEGAPVTLMAGAAGKSILTGDSFIEIGGSHIVVSGFVLTEGWNQSRSHALSFRAEEGTDLIASNSRFTEMAIIDYSPQDTTGVDRDWIGMYGQNNRVDHSYFGGHATAGVTLVVWLDGQPNNHRIDHNHFFNRASGGGANGWETIRIGTSDYSMSSSHTIVEYNLFEEADGEMEIISNKSGDNVFRFNTFLRSQGTLTLRHGDRAWVEGNYFIGGGVSNTGGVRVIGEDHVIINNYFEGTAGRGGAAIAVYAGVEGGALNEYFAAHNALVANNTIINVSGPAITVGEGFGSSDRTVLPTGVTVANNLVYSTSSAGTFVQGEAKDDATYEGNIAFGGGSVGVSTGFSVADPVLGASVDGTWRPMPGSPVINASAGNYPQVVIDIDGQDRVDTPDVGADEILVDAPGVNLGGPLTASTTGPFYLPANRSLPELAPAGFFGPDSAEGLNLYEAGNLGDVWATFFPFLWQDDLGWSYAVGAGTGGEYFLYLYDSTNVQWAYTSNDLYPYMYDYSGERWVYLMESAVGHIWLWDFATSEWIPF